VAPTARLAGAIGVTAIDNSVGAEAATVTVTTAELIPDSDAVISELPAARPVTKPPETVATEVLELVHVACAVIFAVEPSE
jgi:hypothetical protein